MITRSCSCFASRFASRKQKNIDEGIQNIEAAAQFLVRLNVFGSNEVHSEHSTLSLRFVVLVACPFPRSVISIPRTPLLLHSLTPSLTNSLLFHTLLSSSTHTLLHSLNHSLTHSRALIPSLFVFVCLFVCLLAFLLPWFVSWDVDRYLAVPFIHAELLSRRFPAERDPLARDKQRIQYATQARVCWGERKGKVALYVVRSCVCYCFCCCLSVFLVAVIDTNWAFLFPSHPLPSLP